MRPQKPPNLFEIDPLIAFSFVFSCFGSAVDSVVTVDSVALGIGNKHSRRPSAVYKFSSPGNSSAILFVLSTDLELTSVYFTRKNYW